jgi:O-antigen ligase
MWLLDDQRGLLFGNGYQGQYFLGILREIAMLWNPDTPEKMHFHSSSLEVMVNQGLLGIGLFMVIAYKLFKRYREKFAKGRLDGIFFFVLVYLLFDLQVSSFVYLDGYGSVIFTLLAAGVTLEKKHLEHAEKKTEDIVEMNALA